MGSRRDYLIQQIVKYAHKLDEKGFVANHDGNISVKFDDVLLATPTAISKADMTAELAIVLDGNGKKLEGIGKPFSEIKLHLAAYRARSDAKAVIHAHPPFATARGFIGKDLHPQLPEAVVSIGECIPVMPFAMPGAEESESIVASALSIADIFIMPGNGVLVIGDDLEQAYLRLELVEHVSKVDFYSHQMGTPMILSDENVQKLVDKRNSIGLGPQARGIKSQKTIIKNENTSNIEILIAEEIKKVLKA